MRSFLEIMNDLFKAHRERDIVTEKILQDELEERFPETLDLIDF